MTERVGPALARMRLSNQLREMRHDRPAADVARAMHWSLSKLNRIENNKVTIQPIEVEALARHYGVADSAEVGRLVELSVASRRRMWWRDEHEHLHTAEAMLAELDERFVRRTFSWEPFLFRESRHVLDEARERKLIAKGRLRALGFQYVGER